MVLEVVVIYMLLFVRLSAACTLHCSCILYIRLYQLNSSLNQTIVKRSNLQ